MKRLFTFVALCAATLSLTGCFGENYEVRARKWICDHVDHYVNLNKEKPVLYFFEEWRGDSDMLLHVDLKSLEAQDIWTIVGENDVWYNLENGVEGYIIPADKGYSGENKSFVIAGSDRNLGYDNDEFALIFNTDTMRAKKICQGAYVNVHGNIISCCTATSGYGGVITNVDVFDENGNKLVPQRYHGTIARQDVTVELVEKDGNLAGSYYYTKYGPANRIYIYGDLDDTTEFFIEGFNANGYNCETWEGTFENGVITAEFTNEYNGKSYDFTLTKMVE
ncbi:MAG: hypothetical protein J6U95_00705 [Alistipes sp.]|nr:hypothetical protein [Alistipes sp.]